LHRPLPRHRARRLHPLLFAALLALAPSCGSEGAAPAPRPTAFGTGDGTATLAVIHEQAGSAPSDLAFSGVDPTQLWVVRYGALSTLVISNPGTDAQSAQTYLDPASSHFANKPPAMAWGEGNTWATCGDNTNPTGKNNLFMGPALFSGDLAVFAKLTPKSLGSHLDMLHSTPLCRGIAHERANVYWVFNAYDKAIDRYDFHRDHGPGEDDHSDGEIHRYAQDQVLGKDGVPSHLFFSPDDATLYIADTGHARVARLDTRSGTKGGAMPRRNEPLAGSAMVDGATVTDFVPPGTLTAPSGVEIKDGVVYVSDNATAKLWAFDKATAKALKSVDTGLGPGALAGFTFGPDGKIWLVDMAASRVLRLDPK
jgi:hypothetical protein